MATPVSTIDSTGITAPTYDTVLAWLKAQYQGVYGSDVNLDADTQDGQFLAIVAKAMSDHDSADVAAYNAFSPSTAQGNGLSRVVKINGIARRSATYSTVDLLLGGTAGTVITSGYATDVNSYKWAFDTATIPTSGQVTVTATCTEIGAISADAGTITTIGTPTRGWQTVTNVNAATVGVAVETDAELRIRQKTSTAIPSQTILAGLIGAVANLSGVTRYGGVENDTSATDANGVPAHSFSIVVDGGDASTIAATIFAKKGPGAGTYGNTSETVTDAFGVVHTVSFMRPVDVPIAVYISLTALSGYTTNIGAKIKAAVVAYLSGLPLGGNVYLTRLFGPANLTGTSDEATFDITEITISRDGHSPSASNLSLAFYEVATCLATDVVITVNS